MTDPFVLTGKGVIILTRSDVLEWLGWEKCDNEKCRDGYLGEHRWEADDGYGGRVEYRQLEGCPNCLDGLVPPAHQVEAAAIAAFAASWEVGQTEIPLMKARAALIAAMKAVSDD